MKDYTVDLAVIGLILLSIIAQEMTIIIHNVSIFLYNRLAVLA